MHLLSDLTTKLVDTEDRQRLLGQQGGVVWLTGLSGSGKSTLSRALEARLVGMSRACYVLDGDHIRTGLCSDLGFSPKDREENIRRIGHVAALMADAGLVAITAFISPYRSDRKQARAAASASRFVEVLADSSLAQCEARDPKGLYKKARAGKLSGFTGIDAPYEPPEAPEVVVPTGDQPVEACVDIMIEALHKHGLLAAT